jgi:uncharacterized protein YjdB
MRMPSARGSLRVVLLSSVAAVIAAACGSYDAVYDPTTIAVVALRLTPQSVQLAARGERKQLILSVVPDNATDPRVRWSSSDSTVAAVDTTGLVTAVGPGSGVFITARTRDGRHEASVNVSVGQ